MTEVQAMPPLPIGWAATLFSDVTETISLNERKIKQSQYTEKGSIPVIDQGQSFIGGYTDRSDLRISVKSPVIVFGDHTKVIKYVPFDFVAGADGIKVINPSKVFFPKLLYYFMHALKLPEKGYARHYQYLEKSIIPIPPLQEQNRIASKVEVLFSFLDAGIASLRLVQAQLKRYRQAVLKAAFEGKLTQQWREKHKDLTKTATELGIEGASESEKLSLPLLPETWTWVHLDQITESMKNGIYKAKSFYDTKGCACLRMYNIENGVIVWKDIKRMKLSPEEIEEYGLNSDDILVNRVNSRELVGKSAVIPEGLEPCVYESKNIRLRLKNTLASSKYVNYWLLFFGQKYFNRNAQQVVGMASINQTQLGSLPLPFCSPLEQQQIIQEIDNHFSIADTSEKILQPTIQRIESLRQSILKEAFHGRLVPQNPADEPAERLLERIKAERLRNKSKNNQLELSKYVK